MSYRTGPKIVTDGLVLCLDAADQNSFFGYWSPVLSNGANAFDGSLSTAAGVLGGTNGPFVYSFANPPKITSARMYVFLGATSTQVGSNTGIILVNGVDVTQKVKDAGFYTSAGWVDVTNEAKDNWSTFQFKTIAGITNAGIYAIEVNGRVLVGNYDGTTWNDVSGNGRDFTIATSNVSYNTAGYFDISYLSDYAFVGPASNSFGFDSNMEHTIISFNDIGNQDASIFFRWYATPNTGTDGRAIFAHYPYGNAFYYDVAGCCTGSQRLSSSSLGGQLTSDGFLCATWRTRKNTTPNRQFFKNGVSILNSGSNSTATMTWNVAETCKLVYAWRGKLSNFIVYNRALEDYEILQVYNALKGRFGL